MAQARTRLLRSAGDVLQRDQSTTLKQVALGKPDGKDYQEDVSNDSAIIIDWKSIVWGATEKEASDREKWRIIVGVAKSLHEYNSHKSK